LDVLFFCKKHYYYSDDLLFGVFCTTWSKEPVIVGGRYDSLFEKYKLKKGKKGVGLIANTDALASLLFPYVCGGV
jgi:histidyl-tRNA synthetase